MTNEHKDAVVCVCPERDIECGNREDKWCDICPKRTYILAARPEPAGAGVESINTPAFERLSYKFVAHVQREQVEAGRKVWQEIIAHIDAHVAAQVAKAQAAFNTALAAQADACQKRVEAAQATPQAQQPVASGDVPHTYAGFCGSFYQINEVNPTGQEVFNAGMRAGRDLQWPTPAPDAGARDAALEEAAILANELACGDAPLAPEEVRDAIRALKTTPAKPARGAAEEAEDELTALSNELLALKYGYCQLELKLGATEHLLATLRATIAVQESLIKHYAAKYLKNAPK